MSFSMKFIYLGYCSPKKTHWTHCRVSRSSDFESTFTRTITAYLCMILIVSLLLREYLTSTNLPCKANQK